MKGEPMKVVSEEAIEIAKKYSTDDSAAFRNGMLSKVSIDNGLS